MVAEAKEQIEISAQARRDPQIETIFALLDTIDIRYLHRNHSPRCVNVTPLQSETESARRNIYPPTLAFRLLGKPDQPSASTIYYLHYGPTFSKLSRVVKGQELHVIASSNLIIGHEGINLFIPVTEAEKHLLLEAAKHLNRAWESHIKSDIQKPLQFVS